VLLKAPSTQHGLSLSQVAKLSQEAGMNYQMAFRQPGTPFVVPAVVHWKVGHYAALVRQQGDRYLLQDPTFQNDVWATGQALEAETSGYFLLPPGPLAQGWRAVTTKEGDSVWGKGNVARLDGQGLGPCDKQSGGIAPCDPCNGGGGSATNGPAPDGGMAVSSVHLSTVNLNLRDQPVGYSPPVGPPVRFWVRYNHRDAFQPTTFTYPNFGPKWTCDWISYITDDPQNPLQDVNYYIRGGGQRTFTGFDTNSQSFGHQQYDQTLLTRTGPASYTMLWSDGSMLVFAQSDGSIGTARNIFLSQVVDPFGNTVTLTYDSSLRLVGIADAIGQVTTLTYGLTNDIYKVTQVTDPFGRFATFAYDGLGRLTNVTDVIGISSQFVYPGTGDFIGNLVTPYGTNTFTVGGSGTTRFLETVYADGSRDRVEFNQTITQIPMSDSPAKVPQGMATHNDYLQYRNTFFWSRNAYGSSYPDYTKASIYHWLHATDGTSSSGILESVKEPLENRVWYDYAGQPGDSITVGSNNKPLHVGRVLDDGTTQLYTYGYDAFGLLTNTIDPLRRTFSFVYATNGIDLLEVRQTRAGNNELLIRNAYNSQHLPLNSIDAAGQTNTFTYNSRGQILARINPKNEITAYLYDTNGYLVAVDGPLPGTNDTSSATYDSYGRILTQTDLNGYSATVDYDAMDRITRITMPDSSFYQITYDRLDPVVLQDRAGRKTFLEYDPLRQLTSRTDPLGRVTRFQWCSCGSIKSLTDPLGRTTAWHTDGQDRLISKQYGDGSQVTYKYESTTSRLRETVDEKSQRTVITYNVDNTVRSVGYLNATIATPGVSYTYDRDYRRISTITDGIGTTLFYYIPITSPPALGAGQIAGTTGPLPNEALSYSYDELGRAFKTTVDGVATYVGFDEAGRVNGETNALGSFAYEYDGGSDRLVSEVFPNGQTGTRSYGGLLQDMKLQRITFGVQSTPLSEFLYSHDLAASRIATWSQRSGAATPSVYTFGYDAADQLLSAAVTNAATLVDMYRYDYDPAGNRLAEQAGGATNLATYNALNQLNTSAVAAGTRTNEWDAQNRLVGVNNGTQRTEFTYDGLSRLRSIRQLTNGTEASLRRFVWWDNQICEERDGTGATTKRYFRQGMRLESGPNAGAYFYTRDHLKSVREMTDSSGAVRARYSYDPYGRRTRVGGDLDADFGFAGMFWCSEAGLALTRLRAYDPDLGRWLSRDPLDKAEMQEGPNLYAYVGDNPVNFVDPLGLKKQQLTQGQRILSSQCRKALDNWLRKWEDHNLYCEKLGKSSYDTCKDALDHGKSPRAFLNTCTASLAKSQAECDRTQPPVKAAWEQLEKCTTSACKKDEECSSSASEALEPFHMDSHGYYVIKIELQGECTLNGRDYD
jgi:RHS repeat-associated protein